MQSGSNKILRDMNRKHTVEDYLELIAKLKKTNPKIKFSAHDFIIGYPSENIKTLIGPLNYFKETVGFMIRFFIYIQPKTGYTSSNKTTYPREYSKRAAGFFVSNEAEKIKLEYKKVFSKSCQFC